MAIPTKRPDNVAARTLETWDAAGDAAGGEARRGEAGEGMGGDVLQSGQSPMGKWVEQVSFCCVKDREERPAGARVGCGWLRVVGARPVA